MYAFNKDGICVMALLLGAVRTERFCDGALLGFFQKGSIQRWLERLKEIDGGGTDKRDEIFDLKRLPAILAKPRMLTGIERYRSIMEKLWRVDVSLDERFQKTYEKTFIRSAGTRRSSGGIILRTWNGVKRRCLRLKKHCHIF